MENWSHESGLEAHVKLPLFALAGRQTTSSCRIQSLSHLSTQYSTSTDEMELLTDRMDGWRSSIKVDEIICYWQTGYKRVEALPPRNNNKKLQFGKLQYLAPYGREGGGRRFVQQFFHLGTFRKQQSSLPHRVSPFSQKHFTRCSFLALDFLLAPHRHKHRTQPVSEA